MIDKIKEDIIKILDESINALKAKNYTGLKDISNHTIHNASIFQDNDSISIAVVAFSLFKIVQRCGDKDKSLCNVFIRLLKDALFLMKKDRIKDYRRAIKGIFKEISKIDDKLKLYIEEVVDQAEIKKGSKLYEHGISIAQASELLGISQWELMTYVGKTSIIDKEKEVFDIRTRVNYAKSLFR